MDTSVPKIGMNYQTVPAFSRTFDIYGFDCGYGGPLRFFSLINLFQEAADGHARELGLGFEHLLTSGKTWMLSRFMMEIDDLPVTGDRVTVRTWPSGTDRLFALRDIVLQDPEGQNLVRAVYAYLIVDIKARKPVRPDGMFGGTIPVGNEAHPIQDFSFDIPRLDEPVSSFTQFAGPRHLDFNGHVNHAFIMNWLFDAIPVSHRGIGIPLSLKAQFLSEIRENDTIQAAWGRFEGDHTISNLLRDGSIIATLDVKWRT